jgi:RNA polymerase sigma factor (sigma-70 family)
LDHLDDGDRTRRFELAALPHLSAAYNLARWLLGDDQSAQDVVQEAYLRAFRFFDGLRGEARPWLLGIVRNACYTWLRDSGRTRDFLEFDEERDSEAIDPAGQGVANDPAELLLRKLESERVDAAIAGLPAVFREALILRELEELSYEEVARIAAIPVGTVMSRLARGRALLRKALAGVPEEK